MGWTQCSSHRRQFCAPSVLHRGCIWFVLFSGTQKGALQQCFLHLQIIYPADCSCKVSFHLVPMVLLVRIMNVREQAEVVTSKFSDSYRLVLDCIPPCIFHRLCAHRGAYPAIPLFQKFKCMGFSLFVDLFILQWWFSVVYIVPAVLWFVFRTKLMIVWH